jgi:hypothetical protein
MPRYNGTGPLAAGPGTGKGMGRKGQGSGGRDQRTGAGPGGQCVCPTCGSRAAHQPGISCMQIACPQCGHQPMMGG